MGIQENAVVDVDPRSKLEQMADFFENPVEALAFLRLHVEDNIVVFPNLGLPVELFYDIQFDMFQRRDGKTVSNDLLYDVVRNPFEWGDIDLRETNLRSGYSANATKVA
jgi:hypothetical protein